MICPFCAEEIKDEAKKCRYCGEWLKKKDHQDSTIEQMIQDVGTAVPDNSKLYYYRFYLIRDSDSSKRVENIYAVDVKNAKQLIQEKYPNDVIDEEYGLKRVAGAEGKYDCPNCKAKYTICKKDIGCVVLIIIFVSLGIGLIMIPFLPYHCECKICGHKWKS